MSIISSIGTNLSSAGPGILGNVGQAAANALGPAAAALLANSGPFRTQPAITPASLFSLAIRQGSTPYLPLFIYTFPISPADLRKDVAGMANIYDVAGPAQTNGVTRIADVYGLTLPTYTIAGTTGVKYHSTDNFLTTGLESIQILQAAIAQYFSIVAASSAGGAQTKNLPRLEFYDFYSSEFYQVVPVGPQGISQNQSRPQLLNYQFRLAAIYNLLQPLTNAVDSIVGAISGPIGTGISNMESSLGNVLGSYSPFSPGPL